MTLLPRVTGVSYEEYVAMEDASPDRHEYFGGAVVERVNRTATHAALALAVAAELRVALRGRPCFALGSDFRVRLDGTDLSTYPDVSVWCGEILRPEGDRHAGTNPVAVVEVLSPGTRDYDEGAKTRHYLRLPSLRHLVLVDSEATRVELWTRGEGDVWEVRHLTDGPLPLSHLGVTLDVGAIYALPAGLT